MLDKYKKQDKLGSVVIRKSSVNKVYRTSCHDVIVEYYDRPCEKWKSQHFQRLKTESNAKKRVNEILKLLDE